MYTASAKRIMIIFRMHDKKEKNKGREITMKLRYFTYPFLLLIGYGYSVL